MNRKKLIEICSSIASEAKTRDIYTDFNFIHKERTVLTFDKQNSDITTPKEIGIKCRVWDGNKFLVWGQNSLDIDLLKKKSAELLSGVQENHSIADSPFADHPVPPFADIRNNPEKPFTAKSLAGKVSELKQFRKNILSLDPDIMAMKTTYVERHDQQVYINHKSIQKQNLSHSLLVAWAMVPSFAGKNEIAFFSTTSQGLEIFNKKHEILEKIKSTLAKVKKAKALSSGTYDVVLSHNLSGIFAHESFGHGMEADTIARKRAMGDSWVGKRIAPENVNIVDYPNLPGKWGYFAFDDEGVPAQKVYLIKNGIVTGALGDMYTKSKVPYAAAGSSRSETYDHKNYIRMSNTYFEPGDLSEEELIGKVDDGIFIHNSMNGMEDPKGWGVQLGSCFGQRIKNGKLTDEYYTDFALTGTVPELMGNICGLSKTLEIDSAGTCGKGHKELVPVSDGGPYVYIKGAILG